jgi:transcription termination factor Rho
MNRNPKGKPVEPVSGHLEILDKGFGFLRDIDNNYQAGQADTFVPAFMIIQIRIEGGVLTSKGREGPAIRATRTSSWRSVDQRQRTDSLEAVRPAPRPCTP